MKIRVWNYYIPMEYSDDSSHPNVNICLIWEVTDNYQSLNNRWDVYFIFLHYIFDYQYEIQLFTCFYKEYNKALI